MAQDQTKKNDGPDLIAEFRRVAATADFDAPVPESSPPAGARPPPLPFAPTGPPQGAAAVAAAFALNAQVPTLPPAMPPQPNLQPPAELPDRDFAPLAAPPLPSAAALRPASTSPMRQLPSGPAAEPADFQDFEATEPPPAATSPASNSGDQRRPAQRRAALPSRDQIAANDDAPSIGGLIYALNQKPSNRPFNIAGIASAIWAGLTLALTTYYFGGELLAGTSIVNIIARPEMLAAVATLFGPIGVMYALALIMYRAEEMRLRSSAMTEVAVRLAEPDRMAEQSVASLGQAVRRQVSFMNDAVSRALGRAGELEALVHNEVSALERSYADNERKIRGLIQELSGERSALENTSDRMSGTLRALSGEVPELIEKLSSQQIKLAKIIEGAGQNLTQLEGAMATQTGALEHVVGERTERLQAVLGEYTQALSSSLDQRMELIGTSIASRTGDLQVVFEEYTRALDTTLGNRADALDTRLGERAIEMDASLARATDVLIERSRTLDTHLIERTQALDQAFNDRLLMFDDAISRSTNAIDQSIGDKTIALTSALDHHAKSLGETLSRQSLELDESLMQGIGAVRRTSENITRQSIKALEGLASQSELLKNVSENLLGQINTITNRFDNQGQQIMRAANALETVNYKIDKTLQNRHSELSETLDRLSGKAVEFDQAAHGYTRQIEGSISHAESRARSLTAELAQSTEERSRATIADIERLRSTAVDSTDRALEDLRSRFSNVSHEVTQGLSSLTTQFTDASGEAHRRTIEATNQLAAEQDRLRAQTQSLPGTTRESADAMRRVLHDHLRAIDQLSTLSQREASVRDVSRPLPPPQALVPIPQPTREDPNKAISSLGAALSQEMQGRTRPPGAASSAPSQRPASQGPGSAGPIPQGGDAREGWSLGDLLKRASNEEHGQNSQPRHPQPAAPQRAGLDFAAVARSLDGATAAAIWQRLGSGQRGIMVRSIYTPEGRVMFDDTVNRIQSEPGFAETTHQYLQDFERVLQEADRQDPSGRTADGHLRSDYGRAYLFLAHAAGRIV